MELIKGGDLMSAFKSIFGLTTENKTRRKAGRKYKYAAGSRRAAAGPLTLVGPHLTPRKRGRPSKTRMANREVVEDIFKPHVGRPRRTRVSRQRKALRQLKEKQLAKMMY